MPLNQADHDELRASGIPRSLCAQMELFAVLGVPPVDIYHPVCTYLRVVVALWRLHPSNLAPAAGAPPLFG